MRLKTSILLKKKRSPFSTFANYKTAYYDVNVVQIEMFKNTIFQCNCNVNS